MGNLVFQATLGGQVNLVGPNTASTYNLNVPAVSATLATTDANTFTATQTISSANLTFTGTGNRITGDFSNATVANRVMFQTSTANSNTGIYALPNGTSTVANYIVSSNSDPTNASIGVLGIVGSTDTRISSGITGTGTYLPITFYTGGSERARIDTSGKVLIGNDFSEPASSSDRGYLNLAVNDANSDILFLDRGNAATRIGINVSDSRNFQFVTDTNFVWRTGGTSYSALGTGTERARIDSSGNVLVTSAAGLGYGTGSGGTVTQATSKSTTVTLNKPTGQITMNNAALAAGATVGFLCSNSIVSANDTVVINTTNQNSVDGANYSVRATITTGGFAVYLKNEGSGSLSQSVVLNFAIIKGATA